MQVDIPMRYEVGTDKRSWIFKSITSPSSTLTPSNSDIHSDQRSSGSGHSHKPSSPEPQNTLPHPAHLSGLQRAFRRVTD